MQNKKERQATYKYVVHFTEVLESECTVESKRKLTFDEIMQQAEEIRVDGNLTEIATTGVRKYLADAKPGGSAAVARPRVRRRVA